MAKCLDSLPNFYFCIYPGSPEPHSFLMPHITAITDKDLIHAIEAAQARIVFMAPGLWPDVEEALTLAWMRLGPDKVTIILDVDPEVCRLGYGSFEALENLETTAHRQGQALGHEPGLRISVLIADSKTLIYSPAPRLIETAPGASDAPATTSPRANGILLDSPPPGVEKELGAGPNADEERTIGLDTVKPELIESTANDLKKNPPKPFDLARAVNVYNSHLQFVELKVTGCEISNTRAQLPKKLVKIAKSHPELNTRISNSIKLIDDPSSISEGDVSELEITKLRKEISEEFLTHVKGGTVILRSERQEFENRLEKLKEKVTSFSELLEKHLGQSYNKTISDLSDELFPAVRENPPKKWIHYQGYTISDDEIIIRIKDSLRRAFGNPSSRIKKVGVSHIYKDVTYEMLKEPDFIREITEKFPKLEHMSEYSAIKEILNTPDPDSLC